MNPQATNTVNTVAQGGVAITALAFLRQTLLSMVPYAIIAVPLIILDLSWGIRAARHRGERVTFSHAFRRTMNKVFDYLCWIIIASGLSIAFEVNWLEWLILGGVIFNEIISIASNYFETKGIKFSLAAAWRWAFKTGAGKIGVELTEGDAGEIIKEKEEK